MSIQFNEMFKSATIYLFVSKLNIHEYIEIFYILILEVKKVLLEKL